MELEVFEKLNEKDYDQLDVIDQFRSLVINRRYYQSNDFDLKLPLTMDKLNNLKKGNAIRINGVFYYINYAAVDDLENGTLHVKGKSFFGVLSKRIVWENYIRQARAEVIARDLLMRHVINPSNADRKVHQITAASVGSLTTDSIQFQNSYGSVKEQVEKLCETHDFGFKEDAQDPYIPGSHIVFYKGQDLSESVEFTTDAENVLNESYESSDADEFNVALVAGEGEGSGRVLVTYGGGKGLDRKELYVDARDLQQDDLTNSAYQQTLIERAKTKLAEHQPILILDGDINMHNQLYIYKEDYDLGDIVLRSSPTFELAYTARITEVQEIYENGLQIVPTFGRRSPTLIEMLKRK